MQPTPDRIAEIQAALRERGYDPGTTWEETQGACRKIADEHGWQTDHAPDARVLILLGLAGPHSDPAVAQMTGDRLDQDQRSEAARRALRPTAPVPAVTTAEASRPKPPAKVLKRKTSASSRPAARKKVITRKSERAAPAAG